MERSCGDGGQLLLGKRPVKACAGKLQRDAHDLQRQYTAEHGGCDAGCLGPPSPQRGYVTTLGTLREQKCLGRSPCRGTGHAQGAALVRGSRDAFTPLPNKHPLAPSPDSPATCSPSTSTQRPEPNTLRGTV